MRILLLFFSAVLAQSLPAETVMPVLRVNFEGNFAKDMEYIQGSMTLTNTDGSVVALPAKFKTRGATALNYSMKPSFNMKLRETDGAEIDSSLLNLRSCSSWILDAMAIDRICMRNRVAFDIWNAYSYLPYSTDFGSRNGTVGRFVEVYINDAYHGIYCMTDRINRKLLDLKKVKENEDYTNTIRGVLYKHGTTNIEDQSTTGFSEDSTVCVIRYHDAWEHQEPEDYAGLASWQPLLDAYDKNDDYSYVESKYYVDNLADYTLLIMALSIADNWGNKNKYLSIRNIQETGDKSRMVYTPWDLDTSFGGGSTGQNYNGNYFDWPVSSITKNPVAPFSTCCMQASFKQKLKDKWQTLRSGVFSVKSVAARLYEYRDLFVNSGAWQRQSDYFDTQKYKPCYVYDLPAEIDSIVKWYTARFAEMDVFFDTTPSAIETVSGTTGNNNANAPIYDLSGRKVATGTWEKANELLPKGIYTQQGQKFSK